VEACNNPECWNVNYPSSFKKVMAAFA